MPSDLLPTEAPVVPGRRSRLPRGLIGMLALIAGVESFVMRHDYDLTTLIASNWEIEGHAPARFAGGSKILCFGDSMVKFGVQPHVLGATLGKPTYNFALYCGSPQASYYMLRRAFDAGAKPEAIVVDYQPEFLMGDSLKLLGRAFPELLTVAEAADLCWRGGEPDCWRKGDPNRFDRFGEYLVAMGLPSARKRYEIRANLLANIKGQSGSIRENLEARKRNWKVNRGAEALPKNPHYRGEVPEIGGYPAMFWTPWAAHPLNAQYVDRFLELARSRQVPVFWVLQPNAPAVDQKREQVGYNAQYEAFVRDHVGRFANLTVIDGRHVNFDHRVFTDPVHLDRDGATAYSFGIAQVIRARLAHPRAEAGSRFVALPDQQSRAREVALEDFNQSGDAIKAEAAMVVR